MIYCHNNTILIIEVLYYIYIYVHESFIYDFLRTCAMLYTPICVGKGPSDLHFAVNHSQASSVLNNSEIPPQCFLQGVFNSHMLFWDYYTYMGREQDHPPITSQLLHGFLRLLRSQFWEKGTKQLYPIPRNQSIRSVFPYGFPYIYGCFQK